MSTTDTTANQSNDATTLNTVDNEMLKETSLGAWIVANKSLSISLVVIVFLGVIGWGVTDHFKTKTENEKSAKLYALVSKDLAAYTAGTMKAEELVKSVEDTWAELGSFNGASTYIIQTVDALRAKEETQKAYDLTVMALDKISNSEANYFFGVRAAALAEDLGQNEKALEHLNTLMAGNVKYLEDKIYIDLGRLQAKTGNVEKAKTSLQYVIDNAKEAEFQKMAKLLLSELK